MKVIMNNQTVEMADGSTLAQLLEEKGVKPNGIATAVNGVVIRQADRSSTTLSDGDSILVIKAFCGG